MAKKSNKIIEEIIEVDASEGAIVKINSEKKLSQTEIEFNKYAEKIKELKKQLEDIPVQAQKLQSKIDTEIQPLQQELITKRMLFVEKLENAYLNFNLPKAEKKEALDILLGETLDLINGFGKTDLIPFYNTYNEMTYEEEKEEMIQQQKQTMETMYNFFGGFGNGQKEKKSFTDMSMEEIMEEMIKEKLEEEEKQKQRAWEKAERDKNKKKNNRQMEAEQKKQAEDQLFTKSTRTIYTELVKELHPDKELDETKREWKTEVMKKITTAYQNNDLYELLKLQLEYQQSRFQMQEMSDDVLKFYVKVLKNQVTELNKQMQGLIGRFNDKIVELGLGKSNQSVAQKFRREKEKINDDLHKLGYTIKNFTDKKYVKSYLKQSIEESAFSGGDFDFFDIISKFK